MSENNTGYVIEFTTYKFKIFSVIIILILIIGMIVWLQTAELLHNIDRLLGANIYVAVSSWGVPTLIALPCFMGIIYGLFLRLIDKATEQRITRTLKFCLVFGGLALLSKLVYSLVLPSVMSHYGYKFCRAYTAPSMYASDIYVINEGYCIDGSGIIRRDILAWLDQQHLTAQPLSMDMVQEHVELMLRDWDAKSF